MTHESIANAIRSRFKTQIADVLQLVTQYDNMDISKPNGLWCRLSIGFGESFQMSAGSSSRRFRTSGIMTAQLFVPVGIGDKSLLTTAASIVTAFRAITVGDVCYRTPSVSKGYRVDNYWQVNVHCPFYADDIG